MSERIKNFVRRRLVGDPSIPTGDLYDAAIAWDPAVANMSLKEFVANFVVPIKRWEMVAPAKAKPSKRRRAATTHTPGKSRATGGSRARGRAVSGNGRLDRDGGGALPGDRAGVRAVLLDLARDMARAPTAREVVDLVIEIDRYVDRIIEASAVP